MSRKKRRWPGGVTSHCQTQMCSDVFTRCSLPFNRNPHARMELNTLATSSFYESLSDQKIPDGDLDQKLKMARSNGKTHHLQACSLKSLKASIEVPARGAKRPSMICWDVGALSNSLPLAEYETLLLNMQWLGHLHPAAYVFFLQCESTVAVNCP